MVASPYYLPQYTTTTAPGPARNHCDHHYHQHSAASFYQSTKATNQSSYPYSANAVPSSSHYIKRTPPKPVIARPLFKPTLPKDQTDLRVRLFHQLRDASLRSHVPGGFPFRHTLSDLKGKTKVRVSYEPYDIRLSNENIGPNESIGIVYKGPVSAKHAGNNNDAFAAGGSSGPRSSPQYFTWEAYASVREARWNGQGYMYSKSSHKTILAQVRVDPAVMHTSYGKFLRTDSRAISRALAISLELGVLITIVSEDENLNSCIDSSLLARSMMRHRRDGDVQVAPEYLRYWSKCISTDEYEYGYGENGLEKSILYIGTTNNGHVDLLYSYPNRR
ncbi:hypothetical protein HHX47_DHR5001010 [Lentinula edodes]|nr:hypothetical protein HHX47_DHR5001010 [Lentinula edodes]